MSGEDLRKAAQYGDVERVKSIMRDRGNPCSADEYGLTALMYAVWNGHSECVKLLLANGSTGIDASGQKSSSLNLTSIKGYTALHLAALDSPPDNNREIAFNLLLFGVDRSIRSNEDQTAFELANQVGNTAFMSGYREYEQFEKDDWETTNRKKTALEELETYTGEFKERKLKLPSIIKAITTKYYFEPTEFRSVNKEEIETHTIPKPFDVPDFLEEGATGMGALPKNMKIHETQILPLAMEGFMDREGIDSLRCLEFTSDQANINHKRRALLIKKGDPLWEPPAVGRLPWDEKEDKIEDKETDIDKKPS